ncbi:retrovirus-related Pol polyprotein from transposon 412 [Trichonephila clavipes]|nr:retrovirus-related Pol polyprotein from transposon 412 [Trichonephila clavipes]
MPTEQEAKPAVVTPSLQQWRSPSTFRGAPGEDPLKWLKEYDRVANFNKWDDMMCLANVYFFLDGTARQWYVNNEDALDSWEAFKNGLSGLFGDRQRYTRRAEEQLKCRAQRSGESTQSYIQSVLGLCQEVNPLMREDEKVSHLMYRNVVRYVMHCRECQRRKSVPQRPPGRLVPIPPAIAPFHRIGIDLLGRFPKSAHGNKWIIVCTDYSTRYAITKALPTAEVDEIAKFLLEEIVLRHGAPRVIITDRGAVFRSRLVSSLVDLCNIDHRFTTAYHPQTNGLTERFNKTLADMLSMYVDVEQKNWDEILPFVTFAYNTAKQETTGFTPFYLLHGREAETTLDTMLPFCPNDFDDNNITKIAARAEESRQLARVHTLRAQDKDRRRYDSKHQMVSFAPGDLVWVYTPVLRRLSAVTYAVQDFDPASRKRKLREVVHVLRMKPYHDPAEQIETEDIPPKESYKGPITRSRIKTLE